jgi:sec-independent protein translocase protein TatA
MMFLLGPVGPTELILILLIVIIIFGAKKLPDLGKSLGEGIKNFKKSMSHKDREDKDSASPKDEPPAN